LRKIRAFVETQLALTLVTACVLGLLFPYGRQIPDVAIIVPMAAVIFISCFKINVPLRSAFSQSALLFYLARYVALPLLLGWLCSLAFPDYALAVLLLTALPPGASSAALTGLYNGNVALAFVLTIVGSALCVFLIPAYVALIGHIDIAIDPMPIFRTLAFCIFLPGLLYVVLRKNAPIVRFNEHHGRLVSVLLVSLNVFIVIAKQRQTILQDPQLLIVPALIAAGCYFAYALAVLFLKFKAADHIAYGVCSVFNNIALGVGLAILHFTPQVILTTVMAEILWCFLPFFAQPLVDKVLRKDKIV